MGIALMGIAPDRVFPDGLSSVHITNTPTNSNLSVISLILPGKRGLENKLHSLSEDKLSELRIQCNGSIIIILRLVLLKYSSQRRYGTFYFYSILFALSFPGDDKKGSWYENLALSFNIQSSPIL